MADDEVLLAVRYLDHASLGDIAAMLDADVGPVFQTCRQLYRRGYLEKVRTMTYRITADGVEYLDAQGQSAERTRLNPSDGDAVGTDAGIDLVAPGDTDTAFGSGPVVVARSRPSRDAGSE